MKIITILNKKNVVEKTTFIFNIICYIKWKLKWLLLVDFEKRQQSFLVIRTDIYIYIYIGAWWYNTTSQQKSSSQNTPLTNNKKEWYKKYYDYIFINSSLNINENINHSFLISDIFQISLNGILKIYDRYSAYCKEKKIKNNINWIILNNLNNNKTTKMFVEHIESNNKIKDILLRPYIPHWTLFQNTTILAKSLNEMKNYKAQGIFENLINDLVKKGGFIMKIIINSNIHFFEKEKDFKNYKVTLSALYKKWLWSLNFKLIQRK